MGNIYKEPYTVCVTNLKGGVAKTTTSFHLAKILSSKGYKILCIDFDYQANFTKSCMGKGCLPYEDTRGYVGDWLIGNSNALKLQNVVVNINENLDLIPANLKLEEHQENIQAKRIDGVRVLYERMYDEQDFLERYDFIIIDCRPDTGYLVLNALFVSEFAIVPIEPAIYSVEAIKNLLSQVIRLKPLLDEDLECATILPVITKYSPCKESKALVDEIKNKYKEDNLDWLVNKLSVELRKKPKNIEIPKIDWFEKKIRSSRGISFAINEGKIINETNENSNGAKDYLKFTEEFISKVEKYRAEKESEEDGKI